MIQFLKHRKQPLAMKKNKLKKQLIITILALLSSSMVFAQQASAGATTTAQADNGFYNSFLANGLIVFAGLTMLGAVLALFHLLNMMIKVQQIKIYQEQGIEAYVEEVEKAQDPWWKRQYKAWTNVVPVEKEDSVMLDHNYDGIRELDNSLPPWWVAMFIITIIFAVVFLGYYHVLGGQSQKEEYEAAMKVAEESKAAFAATQANKIDEENLEASTDPQDLAIGKTIYSTNCVACHLANGEGSVGPNLTDEFWIHGGSIKNVYATVKNGVPEKGMIAWSAQLKPTDIYKVSSYILTLQGTNPPNAKAPQGVKYIPEEESEEE
jgi:cytochrome c oxidase cbb3-type subunit III